MLILIESKTEILLKIGAILGRVHTGISTVDATVLNASVLKTKDAKTYEVLTG